MKKTTFRLILIAFALFLVLPFFFDVQESEVVRPPAAAKAQAEEEEEAMLPIISVESVPGKVSRFIDDYKKRFTRAYGGIAAKAGLGSPENSAADYTMQANASAPAYNNFIRGMASVDEAYSDRGGYDVNGGDDFAAPGATSSVRQMMPGSAPVKGLYETSSIDPAEAKLHSSEVYNRVMRRVDRRNPSAAPQKEPRVYSAVVFPGKGNAGGGAVYSSQAYLQQGQLVASAAQGRASSDYIGTSGGGSASGRGGGSYGGFSSGQNSGGADLVMPSSGDFNVDAAITESNLRTINEGGSSGSSSATGNNSQQPGTATPGQPGQNPGTGTPNNPSNPNNPNNPGGNNNGGGQGTGPGTPSIVLFDEKSWTLETETKCSTDPKPEPPPEDKISLCDPDAGPLPVVENKDFTKRYKVFVDAGAKDNTGAQHMVPSVNSLVDFVLMDVGFAKRVNVEVTPDPAEFKQDSFAPVPEGQRTGYLNDNNNFILTVSDIVATDPQYQHRALKINHGQLESKKGVAALVTAIDNKIKEEEAKSEQDKKNKEKEVSSFSKKTLRKMKNK